MQARWNFRKAARLCAGLMALLLAGFVSLREGPSFAAAVAYPLSFSTGWNLAGNSLTTPIDVKTTFGSQTSIQTIWKWDTAAARWAFYTPSLDASALAAFAASKGYSLLNTVNPGEGFWVKALAPVSLGTRSGTSFSLAPANLAANWNLAATGDNVGPASFASTIGDVTTLWSWDNANGTWYFYAPALAANGTLASYLQGKGFKDFSALSMGRGLGFWLNYAGASSSRYALLAWNDLGMHCVDGKDYSIMSILPPYNNLHAQLFDRQSGKQVSSGVTLSYEAMADPSGSINTTSSAKTNFWQYVLALYGGAPTADHGLNLSDPAVSNPTPGTQPAPMRFNPTWNWFEAEGLPILPYDDTPATGGGYRKNYYPMVKVVARDAAGTALASTQTVLPVSDEMTCITCHASKSNNDTAKPPASGWANFSADAEKDWKKNVLRLHDDKHSADPVYQAALLKLQPAANNGLAARAEQGTPTLCSSCHGSNALNSPGFSVTAGGKAVKISAFTSAMHGSHGKALDPVRHVALDAIGNRDSCYLCHPGSVTKCLRGAMSDTPNLDCQSCHGSMAAVGNPQRVGWLQQPTCQACHYDGKRETAAVTDVATGALRTVTDTRFATNPNKPAAGFSLFRFSVGHGGSQCEACHGSTHAEYSAKNQTWTSSHDNDLLQSRARQGYAGTITECNVCHSTTPLTRDGGPHGMHTIGQAWVDAHEKMLNSGGASACTACHGADYRGSPLSQVKITRTFRTESRQHVVTAGTQVGCYDCHNGPNGD